MNELEPGVPTRASRTDTRTLEQLARAVPGLSVPEDAGTTRVTGIASRAQDVRPGEVFVAVRGARTDGHDLAPEAVRRGAAAIVAERPVRLSGSVPVLRARASRQALGLLAAEWHGRPSERLRMVGVTGTVGKTSVVTILESLLEAAGVDTGSVGSLGVRLRGTAVQDTGYTAPDALQLQDALARIAGERCDTALMEVTSHALDQDRVHGVGFALGVFTNLIPLEHADYHGSFEEYARVKRRFFDLLEPGALLVLNADDLAVRRLADGSGAGSIGVGTSRSAHLRIRRAAPSAGGTELELAVQRPFSRLDGGEVPQLEMPMRTALLGSSNILNISLATAAALALGVGPGTIGEAVAALAPPRRRMEVIHRGRYTVIDDTVGHPESVSAVFEIADAFRPRRVHVVLAARGGRGPEINGQIGASLAIWAHRVPIGTVVVTPSEETADESDRVDEAELNAVTAALRDGGIGHTAIDRLAEAVPRALGAAGPGDLVLLLGAQGMEDGRRLASEWLGRERDLAG